MLTVNASSLKRLLIMTQRKQTVAGKTNPQVTACVLRSHEGVLSTTSLVRDGKTSVSQFSIACEGDSEPLPIPDIDRLLGVLKAHSGEIKITPKDDNSGIKVKSAKKQTTLQANLNGLAFPHSTETIGAWESKSLELAGKINPELSTYTLGDGTVLEPFAQLTLDANILEDAFSCDSINGQKLNRYRFQMGGELDCAYVEVGDPMKGQTLIKLNEETVECEEFTWSFEGGLENVVSFMSGDVTLSFLDFRKYNQGIRLIITSDNGWFMQAGVLE
tara:strand:- start:2087 stop:2908 length:822 start_codon:yes stop_codon:yes gene_type:complete